MSALSSTHIKASSNAFVEVLGTLSHGSILLLLCALTLAALGLRLSQKRLIAERQRALAREAQIEKLIRSSQSQILAFEHMQHRLQTLEAYVDLVNGRQQQLLANGTVRKHRLKDAIEFAGSGLSGQEIARRSGVNGSEARLIGELYGISVA